jgi:predicted exporter
MDSPFHRLGVSLRDSASAIVEAAANPLLRDPPGEIERARLGLTSPRARLALEVGWLPGVSPARARQLLESLLRPT